MGINYKVTFYDAKIRPDKYSRLIGWTDEQVATKPDLAAALALHEVEKRLTAEYRMPSQDETGITLDGCGFYDYAPAWHSGSLEELLGLCDVGAFMLDIDVEEESGEQWRTYVTPDGGFEVVRPVVTWPVPEFVKNGTAGSVLSA